MEHEKHAYQQKVDAKLKEWDAEVDLLKAKGEGLVADAKIEFDKKIEELSNHLRKHKKDFHSRRGLLQMVADRRKHLKYLEKKDDKTYQAVIKAHGIKR